MQATTALLMVAGGVGVSNAAGASAQASVSVVEAVSVIGLLGSPTAVNDVLLALQSSIAGPATGSRLIRLPNADGTDAAFNAVFGLGASAAFDAGVAAAMSGALAAGPDGGAGTLQGERAAAVTLFAAAGEAPASITVAFN